MLFSAFAQSVQENVMPEGIPENHVSWYRTYTERALVDLQIKIEDLRLHHRDVIPFDATQYSRWASVFEVPDGRLLRLAVMSGGDCEKLIPIRYILPSLMRQMKLDLSQNFKAPEVASTYTIQAPTCYGGDEWLATNGGYGATPPFSPGNVMGAPADSTVSFELLNDCLKVAGAVTDRKSDTFDGVFTVDEGRIELLPRLRSTESAVVWWLGTKKSWADDDEIDVPTNVQQAVEEYVRASALVNLDRMIQDGAAAREAYNESVAMLLYEFRNKKRVPEEYQPMSQFP